jgi:hypothetical protein
MDFTLVFERVYDVLVQHAGASEHDRGRFVARHAVYLSEQNRRWNCEEWRFGGLLGSGGKFWCDPESFRVSCYTEDNSRERFEIIAKTNAALRPLQQEYYKLLEAT